ncbi:MAG TPA: NUDIX domain-containing protein [Bacteroidota bacterium]|nr:NUDIX domain-containing protein [Bacteroidota bacterium]
MPEIVTRIVEICGFNFADKSPRYLLLKRSEKDRIYPGIWQIVTGSIEPGERAVEAGLRELKEETGLTPKRFWVVPHINSFYVADEDTLHHTIFFAAEFEASDQIILSREHHSFAWMKYDDAKDSLVWPGQKKGLEIVHEYIAGGKEAAKLLELRLVETEKENIR